MTDAEIHREALHLWWAREARLPRFVRRAPDALDRATGAWQRLVNDARESLRKPA